MSISLNSSNIVPSNTTNIHSVKTANLTKKQQEIEGQMALNLIASASSTSVVDSTSNTGSIIDIKV